MRKRFVFRSLSRAAHPVLLTVLAALAGLAGNAQQGLLRLNLDYAVALPAGAFRDVVSHGSFRGFDASLMYGLNDRVSIGFNTGFQDFYQKYPRQVYTTSDGSDISAVVTNSVQVVPLMAKVQYRLGSSRVWQPYAGLAAGGYSVLYRQYLGEFAGSNNRFRFGFRPELGIYIPFSGQGESGLTISGVYNYLPFHSAGISSMNSFGIRLGASFPIRE
ncbi:MAG TPA: outer membrane beta-barrel protein [Chitinophagaceae bacterium]|nr:outer membrane beta-barrel protein [Chitinophagaceae bacterium]